MYYDLDCLGTALLQYVPGGGGGDTPHSGHDMYAPFRLASIFGPPF